MKRTHGIVEGFAAALLLGALATGCAHNAEPKYASVAKGTEIPLILIKELESGADAVGTVVPMMADADIVSPTGDVVVRKGAIAYGKVVRSRGEGMLSGMANQPARLDITIFKIGAIDGAELKISAVKDGDQEEPLELNRDNTGVPPSDREYDKAWAKPDSQKDLVKLVQIIQTSKNSDLANNPASAELLRKLASELNLSHAATVTGAGSDGDRVARYLGQIANGRVDLETLAKASSGQIGALIELVKVVGYVGHRLGEALKGRQIRAHVGTPLKAYIVEDARVLLPEPN